MPQMPSIPYASPTMYNPDRGTERLIDLMLRRGDVEARGQAASGAIWGRAVEDVGQIAAGAVQQYGEQKKAKAQAAALDAFVASDLWVKDPKAGLTESMRILGPDRGMKFFEGLQGSLKLQNAKTPAEARATLPVIARAMLAAPPQSRATYFAGVSQLWEAQTGQSLGEYNPEQHDPIIKSLAAEGVTQKQTPAEIEAEAAARARGTAAGSPPKPPALQTLTVPGPGGAPMAKSFTPEQVAAGVTTYKAPPAALVINPQKEADSEANAQMMVDGRALPTTFSKRGTDFNHLIAKADKLSREQGGKGFNPIKLQLDYEASKRFVGALNSSQMVRFKGLAGSVVNTIDEVKMLAEQLKQGGVQKWNQAKRDTILQVYGNTPQSALAAQYVSAVNTLKEEFANLAQGGYAPTEAAWKLAEQQINGNYGLKDFNASVTEAQRLINYRLGAFDELAPSLLGGGGQSFSGAGQGAAPAGGPKELTYNPKTGKLE